jgi:hypothetical protein
MAVALSADVFLIGGLVLLDAIWVGAGIGADSTQPFELAGHNANMH